MSVRQYCFALAALLLLVSWLLPNHYVPWVTAYQEFAAFGAALTLLFVLVLHGPARLLWSVLLIAVLAMVPLLQYLAGVIYFAGDAWLSAFYLLGLAVMLQVGYGLSLEPDHRLAVTTWLAAVFVAGASISVVLLLIQLVGVDAGIWVADLPPGARPFANLAQPNNLASLFVLGLVGLLYLRERAALNAIASGLLAVLLVFGLALTQSRTPWVMLFVFVVMWAWRARAAGLRTRALSMWTWVLGYAVLWVFAPYITTLLTGFGDGAVRVGAFADRIGIWSQAVVAILQGPLFGYGWNQVAVAQMIGAGGFDAPVISMRAHNIVLDLMLWVGLLPGAAISLAFAWWGWTLLRRVSDREGFVALLGVAALAVHAMLEFPLEYAFFLLPFGFMLGVAAASGGAATNLLQWRFPGFVILVCGVVVLVIAWKEYRVLEEDFRLMRFEVARIGTLKAASPAPDVLLFDQLAGFLRFVRTPPTADMGENEVAHMQRVAYRYPTFSGLYRYVIALNIVGRQSEADAHLELFRKLYGENSYERAREELARETALRGRNALPGAAKEQ